MQHEDLNYFTNRLQRIKSDIDSRLESLIKLETSHSRLSFEDIDERIDDCLKAIERLEDTIRNCPHKRS